MPKPHPLDLVLVNPGAQKQVYQGLSDSLSAIEPPVWVGLLATFCRKRGLKVAILDAEAEGLSPDQAGKRVAELDPVLAMVVAFGSQPSASTQKMTASGMTTKAIREHAPGTYSMLGGVHPSALPQRTLEEEVVDFVCEGEGPYTLEALIPLLKTGDLSKLDTVPGLWYRDGDPRDGLTRSTGCAPLVEDLDKDLDGVAWDLLPMDRYRAHNWHCFGHLDKRKPYGVIYTTLGCPFKCSFCCINAPFGGPSYRYRSPARVVDEIELLVKKYGVYNIKILDEMFVLNQPHVAGICDGIIARGLKVNIWAYARVDTVKAGLLPKLKAAGVNWLALGIESASEFVRDGVDKDFKATDIAKVVKAIQDAGIYVIGNYIFGLPDDTRQSMEETLAMAQALNCEMANFYCAMAYPGSKLYTLAVEKGWPMPPQWHAFSQHAVDTLPLPSNHLKAGEILKFRDEAFHRYFEAPEYLAMVERRFGPETRRHIEDMAKFRITRTNYGA